MPRPKQANQRRLAERLREVRIAGNLSGSALARNLGWVQSRVSKLEIAEQVATTDDVTAWADALNLDASTRAELIDLAELAQSEYQAWRAAYFAHGSGARAQEAIGHLDQNTVVTRHFVIGLIPGLLQTPAYARDVITCPGGPGAWGADAAELDKIVAARMKRQAVLRDPDRTFKYVFAEAALRNRFGSTETLSEQLQHLERLLAELKTVEVRVVPQEAVWPAFPISTFKIRDDSMVMLEQQVGEHTVVDPKQVAAYVDQFELLTKAALSPRRSLTLIREVAGELS